MASVGNATASGSCVGVPKDRVAGKAVHAFAVLYVLHTAFVFYVGPANEDAARTMWVASVIACVVTALLVWSGFCIRQGGRLAGAVFLCFILSGGLTIGAVLAANTLFEKHPWFMVEQIVVALWGVATLFVLACTHGARLNRGPGT